MKTWVVDHVAPIDDGPLALVNRDRPEPGPGRSASPSPAVVSAAPTCTSQRGAWRPDGPSVTPGHEVVGRVDALGDGASRFRVGQRIGVPRLARTDGSCGFCRRGDENLCVAAEFTGWDRDGGYADYYLADEAFAYLLPDTLSDK